MERLGHRIASMMTKAVIADNNRAGFKRAGFFPICAEQLIRTPFPVSEESLLAQRKIPALLNPALILSSVKAQSYSPKQISWMNLTKRNRSL